MTTTIVYRNKYALIVGINDYQHDPLYYCINDAEDLETALQSISFNVVCGRDCTHDEFYRLIDTFANKIEVDDLVLFYFAGHGKQNNAENYLLPKDYDYDHRESERDYIVNHAINIKYIMKKISDRKCPVAIYLFDCCRSFVRTRSINDDQGLSFMNAPSHTLIVYACAPGKTVLDETQNNRNGSFMENLLKYITTPNTDIEEIMKNVAYAVNAQTQGFQLPHRGISLKGRVFLVANDSQGSTNVNSVNHRPSPIIQISNQHASATITGSSGQGLQSIGSSSALGPLRNAPPPGRPLTTLHDQKRLTSDNISTSQATNTNIASLFTEHPKWPVPTSNSSGIDRRTPRSESSIKLPGCNTVQNTPRPQPNAQIATDTMPKRGESDFRHSGNRQQITTITACSTVRSSSNRDDSTQPTTVVRPKTPARNNEKLRQSVRPAATTNSLIYDKYFQDDDDDDDKEGNAANESVPLDDTQNTARSNNKKSRFFKKTAKNADCMKPDNQSIQQPSNINNTSDSNRRLSNLDQPCIPPSITIDKTDFSDHLKCTAMNQQQNDDLIIFVQSLKVRYTLSIPFTSTIEQLKNIIWQNININTERCQKDSYVLLLFTHRMHIFQGEETELVSEFIKLTPSEPHFYFYALKRYQQSDEMYTYETKASDLFATNADWWIPVHFMEDAQLPRPQSVLLSSLYALRLFFNKYNDESTMWRQAMEAQFFIHLRKYLFPPAVLALKHAVEGALFWFEKPLIVDSLLQLLMLLCPSNIKRNELCDCIPLLFCWLFEECDPNVTEGDFYQLVSLVDLIHNEKHYFDDPATAFNAKREPLVMRERKTISIDTIRHVDIRSFTRYMKNKTDYANITYCKCDEYLIYDPPKGTSIPVTTINHLTADEIKQLYAIMAQKYQSFTLITRGALRSDINDQLVVMQDRTVALIFTRKMNRRPQTGRSITVRPVEHVFEVFNPLQYTTGIRQYVGADQLYQLSNNSNRDVSLPAHFLSNVCDVPHIGPVHDSSMNARIQQITVIALDISRSMFEKPASPDPNNTETVLDMSIIMLGTMCDNIVFGRCAHDVGLIHFGTSIEEICPITRNRNDFEKALTVQPKSEEWTCMYDALSKATSMIVTHENRNKKFLADDCKKLIICISDGIDNHSNINIEDLEKRLEQHKIVVDFVSFLRDDLLKNKEKDTVNTFRQLCRKRHGYVYQNLPIKNIELAATFEREAAVWICERESKSFGFVDKPVHRMPSQLHYEARYQVPLQSAQGIRGASNPTRVLREANNVTRGQLDNIKVYICRNDISFWKIILDGPSGTPYEGGRWILYVQFGLQYPRQPPTIRFVTEIYHVNVSADGKICHELFDRGWTINTTMIDVFQSILQLLKEPNFKDPISTEKAQLWKDQPNEYHLQLNECMQRHGKKSLDQLKREFQLED